MKTVVDARFRREAETFVLRFSCDDCCHRVDEGALRACSMAFPADLQRASIDAESLAFCKSFELA